MKLKKQLINKQERIPKVKVGYPSPKTGADGDMQIRAVPNKGLFLFYKFGNNWYGSRMIKASEINNPRDDRRVVVQSGSSKKEGEINRTSDTLKLRLSDGTDKELYRAGGTDIPIADGGTGASSFTDGGILLGSGTDPITATAVLGDGEILVGDGTTDPVVLDVGSSTAITVLGDVTTGAWGGTYVTVLPTSKGGVSVTGTTENSVLTLGASANNFIAETFMKFYTDEAGLNFLEFTSSGSQDDSVDIFATATAHNVAGDDITLQARDTTSGPGGHLIIKAGRGKGAGNGGSITFSVAPRGASGVTDHPLNDEVQPLIIDGIYGTVSFFKAAGFDRISAVDATNVTIDFRDGNKAHLDMAGGSISGTLTLQFPDVSGNFVLVVEQDTSTRTIAAFATKDAAGNAGSNDGGTAGAIRWAGGSAPTLTAGATTNNARDILSFYWDADEEVCYGTATHNF